MAIIPKGYCECCGYFGNDFSGASLAEIWDFWKRNGINNTYFSDFISSFKEAGFLEEGWIPNMFEILHNFDKNYEEDMKLMLKDVNAFAAWACDEDTLKDFITWCLREVIKNGEVK